MKFRIACFLFFILNSITLYGQIELNTDIESIKNEYKDHDERIKQFMLLLANVPSSSNTMEMGHLFHELASSYSALKENEEAIRFVLKAISIKENYKNDQLESLNNSRFLLGKLYNNQGDIKLKYQVFLKISEDEGADYYTHIAYRVLASEEIKKGDVYKAISKLNIGLANKELCKTLSYDINLRIALIAAYSNLYESTYSKNRSGLELEIVKKHQAIIERDFSNSSLKEEQKYAAYNNLANIYEAFGEWEQALELYTKAKKFYNLRRDVIKECLAINNLAIVHSKQGDHKIAANYFNYIIDNSSGIGQMASAYNNLGYYLPGVSAKERIPYSQRAINTVLEEDINTSSFRIPSLERVQRSGYEQNILIYLIDLVGHYMKAYKENKEISYLYNAQEALNLVDELVSLIRHQSVNEQSKLFWIEKGVNIYILGAEVSFLLNNKEDTFYFMEKNKALLLQENIRALRTKIEYDVPNKTLEREYSLYYERQKAFKKQQENSANQELGAAYSASDKRYASFMDSLTLKYPFYTQVKKEIEIASLKDVTVENTCFVEYILDDKKGYGLFYSPNETIVFEIEDVPSLQLDLKSLKKYFASPVLNQDEKDSLHKKSFSVFEKLFPFPNAGEKLMKDRLIVIPDQNLQMIPFEALSVVKNGRLSESYLVHQTEVSYLQSFSVFEQIKNTYHYTKHPMLVVAPHTFEDAALPQLTGSKVLSEELSSYQDAKILYENEATASAFLEYQSEQEIIHLNTHAGVDSVSLSPWIAFHDRKLFLNELYGLQNQAELVVLDACKTNTGKYALGEGVINLSRGFFSNGSQSVLASLWNVNEKSSNTILSQFYSHLETGQTKSKALRSSKIDYLNEHEFIEVLPYYWAAFTLTGSTKAIVLSPEASFSSAHYTMLILGLGALLLMTGGYLRSFIKRSSYKAD